eukprot:1683422-Rhodomonas_salina.1
MENRKAVPKHRKCQERVPRLTRHDRCTGPRPEAWSNQALRQAEKLRRGIAIAFWKSGTPVD